jgi:hypothetical protein
MLVVHLVALVGVLEEGLSGDNPNSKSPLLMCFAGKLLTA